MHADQEPYCDYRMTVRSRDPQRAGPVRPSGDAVRRGGGQPRRHRHRRGAAQPHGPRHHLRRPERVPRRARREPPAGAARLQGALGVRPRLSLHLGGKISTRSKLPIRTRNTLSMAYTPGVARVCRGHRRGPRKSLRLHEQGEQRRGGHRRLRHPGTGQSRPGGGDAGHGRQDHAVQGVRRHRRLAVVPGHAGRRRHRRRRQAPSPPRSAASTWKTSAPALLRDRGASEGGTGHSGDARRPARHGRGSAGGAAERAEGGGQGRQARSRWWSTAWERRGRRAATSCCRPACRR